MSLEHKDREPVYDVITMSTTSLFMERTIIFCVVTIIVVSVAPYAIAFVPRLPLKIKTWYAYAVVNIGWAALLLSILIAYAVAAIELNDDIHNIQDKADKLLNRVQEDCTCLSLKYTTLLENSLHQLVLFSRQGLDVAVPLIIVIGVHFVLATVALSIWAYRKPAKARSLFLIIYIHLGLAILFSALPTLLLTDVLIRINSDMGVVDDPYVRIAGERIACDQAQSSALGTSVPTSTCPRDGSSVAGCVYADSVFAKSLMGTGLTGEPDYTVDLNLPLNYNTDPSIECTALCAVGPSGTDFIWNYLCDVKLAVAKAGSKDIHLFRDLSMAYAYTMLFSTTLVLIVLDTVTPLKTPAFRKKVVKFRQRPPYRYNPLFRKK